MKWFQHHSDTYSNIKMQEILERFGLSGYGLFWLCCELIAQQGKNYQIDNDKNWKKAITRLSGLTTEKLENILSAFSDLRLIDQKSLEKNILFIPKMSDYSDDYTNKLRRMSEQTPNNDCTKSKKVVLDKIRIDKNRLDKSISRFAPPPLEEVKSYCLERDNGVDYDKWFNFYSAKGWLIGKNKMKDWKAAVRTWEPKKEKIYTDKEIPKAPEVSEEQRIKNLKKMEEVRKGLNKKMKI